MTGYDIKVLSSNEVQIIYSVKKKVERDIVISVGQTYWVQPDNAQKLKHRGKECVVKGFTKDNLGTIQATKVYFIDSKKSGRVDICDLVKELKDETIREVSNKIIPGPEPRYTPDNVPDGLYTKNQLNQMGKIPTGEPEAYVVYSDQKREFKLFNINSTRDRK